MCKPQTFPDLLTSSLGLFVLKQFQRSRELGGFGDIVKGFGELSHRRDPAAKHTTLRGILNIVFTTTLN